MDKLTKLIHEALGLTPKKSCSCGCNSCGNKAPILNENKQYDYPISIHMRYHIDKKIPLHDTNFAVGSSKYKNFIKEAKLLAKKGIIKLNEEDEKFIKGQELGNREDVEFTSDLRILPYDILLGQIIASEGIDSDLYHEVIGAIFDRDEKSLINILKKYKVYNKYQQYLHLNENSSEKLYKLEGILITDTNIRPQSEILSDIRSLPGITIVNNEDYNVSTPKEGYLYTHAVIKVDPYVYLKDEEFNIGTIEQILQSIKDVKGVVTYKAEPKLINIGI